MINRETIRAYLEGLGAKIEQSKDRKKGLIELYKWARENTLKGEITILATHGEANCDIWDEELYEEMRKGLETGKIKERHCLGPIISSKPNNHFNAIVECFKNFIGYVNLYITKTRYPYHWILVKLNDKDIFRFKGEFYHKSLDDPKETYSLGIEESFQKEDKIIFRAIQEDSFNSLMERSFHITKFEEIKEFLFINEKICKIKEKAREKGYCFDTLGFSDIKEISDK